MPTEIDVLTNSPFLPFLPSYSSTLPINFLQHIAHSLTFLLSFSLFIRSYCILSVSPPPFSGLLLSLTHPSSLFLNYYFTPSPTPTTPPFPPSLLHSPSHPPHLEKLPLHRLHRSQRTVGPFHRVPLQLFELPVVVLHRH